MPCYRPISARISEGLKPNGSHQLYFRSADQGIGNPVKIPCGRCVGCRLERSRQWAVRCVHEASLYVNNCFVSLTYNDD